MQIMHMEQHTPEWHDARKGIPTASRFGDIMAKGRGDSPSKSCQTYLAELIGERITDEPAPSFTTAAMQRGHDMEPTARTLYELERNVDVTPIGFVANHGAGCSPDGFVGDVGMLEIKTHKPSIFVPMLRAGTSGDLHIWQVQGQLWITGREWCDLMIYWPGMPFFCERIHRDATLIDALQQKVGEFIIELEDGVTEINLNMDSEKFSDPEGDAVEIPAASYTAPPADHNHNGDEPAF